MGIASSDFLQAFRALPIGTFTGTSDGRRYTINKSSFANGKSWKLIAEELGGTDYISLNLYLTDRQAALRPCEMPEDKVVRFVLTLQAHSG
ncbi:MAG: hypothetical protein AAGP08_05955 [Pseudomonadota bacterium]